MAKKAAKKEAPPAAEPAGRRLHVSGVVDPGAAAWVRERMRVERRSMGYIVREAIDAYYRALEETEPPWRET